MMDPCEVMGKAIETLPEKLLKGAYEDGQGNYCALGWLQHSVAEQLPDSRDRAEFYSYYNKAHLGKNTRIVNDNDTAKTYKIRRARAVKNFTAIRDAMCEVAS